MPVRADREPDDDVRVRELVRTAGDVLAHERHRQQPPRARHARAAAALEQRHVGGLEQAVAHAVDLRQHVREKRADPVTRQVDHLERLVFRLALDHLARLAELTRARQVSAHVVLGDAARRAARAEPQLGPFGEQRRQELAVPLAIQQHDVRLRLDALRLGRLLDAHGNLLQDLRRLVRAARLLRGGAPRGGAKHRVQDEKRELPSQPVAGARLGEVQRHAAAEGPVQLGAQRVQDEVHFVQHQHARALEQLDDLRGDRPFLPQLQNLAGAQPSGVDDALRAAAELGGALEQPAEIPHVRLDGGAFDARDVALVQQVRGLQELEHQRLERGGRRDNECPRPARLAQRVQRRRRQGREPIKLERHH